MTLQGEGEDPEAGVKTRPQSAEPSAPFFVVPAVDLLGEEAVRLERGEFERVRVRAGDPEALVARFASAGARLIHLVDLDGARVGVIRPPLIARLIATAGDAPVQVSGGIRSIDDAEALLAAGASRVVVGTAAFETDRSLERYATALGERLVVSVDARNGNVAVSGWSATTTLPIEAAAHRCAETGVSRLLCTAVERDGTLAGPDLELLARVRASSGLPILAAGGIRAEADLADVADLGLEGAIVGRALLEGLIPLEALTREF